MLTTRHWSVTSLFHTPDSPAFARRAGDRLLQLASGLGPSEHALLQLTATGSGRPVSLTRAVMASIPRWRGLGANDTRPTKDAPPSAAARTASAVFTPQILVLTMLLPSTTPAT